MNVGVVCEDGGEPKCSSSCSCPEVGATGVGRIQTKDKFGNGNGSSSWKVKRLVLVEVGVRRGTRRETRHLNNIYVMTLDFTR